MDYLVQIILACVGVIGSGSSVVMWVLFRKQTARIKNAEAVEKEVQSLRSTVDALQQQQEFYEKRLKAMQDLVIGKDNYIAVISNDKQVLEVKHAKIKARSIAPTSASSARAIRRSARFSSGKTKTTTSIYTV